MENLTIKDIAKLANVSVSTVSLVLNDRPGPKKETRDRVRAIIAETGFTPNAHTQRLSLKRSFTVHVVMRQYAYNLFNFFALELLLGILQESRELGYDVIFTTVDFAAPSKKERLEYVLDTIRAKTADGIIFIQISDPALLTELKKENIPYLCVDSHVKRDGSVPLLEVDYFDAAYRATEYLISKGHTKIGFIGSDAAPEYYISTLNGYMGALRDAGLPCRPDWIRKSDDEEHYDPACMENILSCKQRPTAIFCAGDIFAIGAVKQATKAGLRVPEDISFMSVDDLIVSEHIAPPLSTMSIDKSEMGVLAMKLIYDQINGEPYEKVNLVKTHLVQRHSVYDMAPVTALGK